MSGVKRKDDSKDPVENAKKPRGDGGKEDTHDLGGKKKASVSVFKGKVLVNIREYYVDKATGEEKPGNKGIALTKEQWEALLAAAPQLNEALNSLE